MPLSLPCEVKGEHWLYLLALLAYAGLEYWLGKTQKTQAASLLELIVIGATAVVALVLVKLKGDSCQK